MKGSGRVSLVGLAGVLALGFVFVVFFFGKESLTSVGGRFMQALARGDVDTLTKMSYTGNKSPDEMRKEWDFTVNKAGKYYNFSWHIVTAAQADANNASVKLQVMRNPESGSAYDENFAIPLVRVGDEWKVDVKGISREMYPGLPR